MGAMPCETAACSRSRRGKQFVLAMLQRIRHGVERVGNPREFGISPDVHTSGKFAEPPLVRGVDQLTQRAMDEQPGPQRCQDQYQRGAQGDQEAVSLRVIFSTKACALLRPKL